MRKRTPRGMLSRHTVMDAALTLADTSGFHGVTIRALAAQVGVPQTSDRASYESWSRNLSWRRDGSLGRVRPSRLHRPRKARNARSSLFVPAG
jgi:hypothetical protein